MSAAGGRNIETTRNLALSLPSFTTLPPFLKEVRNARFRWYTRGSPEERLGGNGAIRFNINRMWPFVDIKIGIRGYFK